MMALLIADDLTGALDSAVALASVGLRCRVARHPADIGAALADNPEVLAVSTASREGEAAAARDAVMQVLAATAGAAPAILFKKVDSRLKGNVAAELRAVAEVTGISQALVAPAIPAQDRTTTHGRVVGAGIAAPIDVAAACAGSGLALLVPDIRSDADLDAALAGPGGEPGTLLVGAAGLAAALARRLRPGRHAPKAHRLLGPLLLAIGSRDPITLAQVASLRAAGKVAELPAPGGRAAEPAPANDPLLVQLVPDGTDLHPREAGARFARTVAGLVHERNAGTLFACGGETADGILGELGAGVLAVEGELLPGVPLSDTVVNDRTMRIVTKSGGFGTSDTLLSVVEASGRGDEAHDDE
jgi:uncharacterized protein YgbK (DUF1537 family)